jgi:hypothetical protein
MSSSKRENETDTDPLNEELVAYLDGELPPDRNEEIERRLSVDPDYRQQLRNLEKTWEFLDVLPKSEPTSSFTKSTMELLVSSLEQQKQKSPAFAWRRWLAFTLVPIVILAMSYWITRQVRMRPYNELIHDLAMIENFDVYRKVDLNLDFVKKLADDSDMANFLPKSKKLNQSEDPKENENALKAMPEDQLRDLQAKQVQYRDLSEADKQRLRRFHQLLISQQNVDQLYASMRSFYEWLKTLEVEQQTKLLIEEDTDKKYIIFQKLREDLTQVDQLQESDFTAFSQWVKDLAAKFGKKIASQSKDLTRQVRDTNLRQRILKSLMENDESAVRAYLLIVPPGPLNELQAEYIDLKSRLSETGQKIMGDDPQVQFRFIRQMLARPQIDPSTLESFYFEELTPEEQDELDRLSPELMRKRVYELYMRRKLWIVPPRPSDLR